MLFTEFRTMCLFDPLAFNRNAFHKYLGCGKFLDFVWEWATICGLFFFLN